MLPLLISLSIKTANNLAPNRSIYLFPSQPVCGAPMVEGLATFLYQHLPRLGVVNDLQDTYSIAVNVNRLRWQWSYV